MGKQETGTVTFTFWRKKKGKPYNNIVKPPPVLDSPSLKYGYNLRLIITQCNLHVWKN